MNEQSSRKSKQNHSQMPNLHPLSPNKWRQLWYNKVYKLDMSWVGVFLSQSFIFLEDSEVPWKQKGQDPHHKLRGKGTHHQLSHQTPWLGWLWKTHGCTQGKCRVSWKTMPHFLTFPFVAFFSSFLSSPVRNSKPQNFTGVCIIYSSIFACNKDESMGVNCFSRSNDAKEV